MIHLVAMHLFYGKRRWIYIGFYILMMMSIILIGYVDEPDYIQILDRNYYQEYFNLTIRTFLPMVFPIFMLMLMVDHDQQAFYMIVSYRSRLFVYIYKLFGYMTIMMLCVSFMYLFLSTCMVVLTAYYEYNKDLNSLFIHLCLDSVLLISWFLIWIKKEHINRGFILILIYLIYPMFIESIQSKAMFYILPIYTQDIEANWLVYAYKICYICSGILLGVIINERKRIYG